MFDGKLSHTSQLIHTADRVGNTAFERPTIGHGEETFNATAHETVAQGKLYRSGEGITQRSCDSIQKRTRAECPQRLDSFRYSRQLSQLAHFGSLHCTTGESSDRARRSRRSSVA